MPPPASAEQLASRLFLGPALRTQPDRRLVTLVREGYEAAFEEIVRRYRKPLDRFAAAIVGGRSEDVTQDAFSKALLALRGSETEIELRPWLYRIVRNTALNDLRDGPPPAVELGEELAGGRSAAEEAERREEMTELMQRLRALPEPQRAAIVMRELEGLSHEEIAAALGVSGGAARQAIYRGRQTLRDGFGLLLPLPLLRLLIDHGVEAAAGAGAGGAVAAGAAGASVGGAGGALKVGLATALIAGSVGAGVAVEQRVEHGGNGPAAATADVVRGGDDGSAGGHGVADDSGVSVSSAVTGGSGGSESRPGGGDRSGHGPDGPDDRNGSSGGVARRDENRGHGGDDAAHGGPGREGHGGPGPSRGGRGDDDDGDRHGGVNSGHRGHDSESGGDGGGPHGGREGSGPGPSGSSDSGSHRGGGDDLRSPSGGGSGHPGGSGGPGSGGNSAPGGGGGGSRGGSDGGNSGSGSSDSPSEPPAEAAPPPPEEEESTGSGESGEDDS